LKPTWGTTTRKQDMLDGSTTDVTEDRAWQAPLSISLSVGISLPPKTKKVATPAAVIVTE